METRREFVKKAAMLSGAAGLWSALPASIVNALAIDPQEGTTFLDAEHVVILMQENRSFDHSYGMLRGVRGFNDPRAFTLPDGNPVWLQTNAAGQTYIPFRLNIKETNATWMGSLPHSWTNQVDARNGGKYDKWLIAKPSGHRDYAAMPLTLGYYDRQDLPFYYALADAFTVCDMNFCSSLTGTTPNRLYLWTGTVREKPSPDSPPCVRNEEVDYGREAKWTTFPERLEDHGISWKIYQNELSLDSGFRGEEDAWLSNFTDNPIEWFTQYQVRFSATHRAHVEKQIETLRANNARTEEQNTQLTRLEAEREKWSKENFDKLSTREKNIHAKAFCTNVGDPDYRQLTTLTYKEGETERKMQVPKGDVLYQFRKDVDSGQLPTVSWLVPPENFSDHPGAAWYGAWFLSEVIEILTKKPEVWKKTVFIMTYDENDGYFDHVPPFVPPHPSRPETGMVSKGIDTSVEYVEFEQDRKRKPAPQARESPIGLGYRVPMVIASPWSRGGMVCSEVFDHTSVLQFLEVFLSHKTGKKIEEPNISLWRRTICGDLTSAFQPYRGEKMEMPKFVSREPFLEQIHNARFKKPPTPSQALTKEQIEQVRKNPLTASVLPVQEKGVRRAHPLPYQLAVEGRLAPDRTWFTIRFEARNTVFGKRSAGAPFNVYAILPSGDMKFRSYAVAAGDSLTDGWALSDFEGGNYHLRVDGPNGFFRTFRGNKNDPAVEVTVDYHRSSPNQSALSGKVEVQLVNRGTGSQTIEIRDNAYKNAAQKKTLAPGTRTTVTVDTQRSFGWYDLSVRVAGQDTFEKRYAGRVETGKITSSDPAMGKTLG
jgi:phospholipase C